MDTALATTDTPAVTLRHVPSALHPVHRGKRLSIVTFALCIVALAVAAVLLSIVFTEADGGFVWAMVLLGAGIIGILLASVLIPFLKEIKQHERH